MATTAVDNDVAYKAICYAIAPQLLSQEHLGCDTIAILGSARFVLTGLLKKERFLAWEVGEQRLADLLEFSQFIEPSEEEVLFAADLEAAAMATGLQLDTGESLLASVLTTRGLDSFVTGDKRAVEALGCLRDDIAQLEAMDGKVVCLEMIVADLLQKVDPVWLRSSICAQPKVDRSLAICFSCSSETREVEEVLEGLRSYTSHARKASNGLIAPET